MWNSTAAKGLRSLVVKLGVARSLRARAMAAPRDVRRAAGVRRSRPSLGVIYYCAMPLIAAALVYEHRSAASLDLAAINRAFFQSNAFVSAVFRRCRCGRRGGSRLTATTSRAARCGARDGRLRTRSSTRPARSRAPVSSGITRSPSESTLASLCWRESRATLFVPAERATHAAHFVRRHRLAVARAAENDRRARTRPAPQLPRPAG